MTKWRFSASSNQFFAFGHGRHIWWVLIANPWSRNLSGNLIKPREICSLRNNENCHCLLASWVRYLLKE
jgi:hypothetical protein